MGPSLKDLITPGIKQIYETVGMTYRPKYIDLTDHTSSTGTSRTVYVGWELVSDESIADEWRGRITYAPCPPQPPEPAPVKAKRRLGYG